MSYLANNSSEYFCRCMVLLIVFVMSFTIAFEVPIRTGIANANAIIVGIRLMPHRLLKNSLERLNGSWNITFNHIWIRTGHVQSHVNSNHVMRRARDWVIQHKGHIQDA
jgi:hypothetical protein